MRLAGLKHRAAEGVANPSRAHPSRFGTCRVYPTRSTERIGAPERNKTGEVEFQETVGCHPTVEYGRIAPKRNRDR